MCTDNDEDENHLINENTDLNNSITGSKSGYIREIYWYQIAAENGNKNEKYGNGIEKDEDKVFEWYRKSAEQECIDAQNSLGFCYEKGIGTEKDLEKAVYWYQQAAENGNKFAQYNLGRCHQHGDGVEKD